MSSFGDGTASAIGRCDALDGHARRSRRHTRRLASEEASPEVDASSRRKPTSSTSSVAQSPRYGPSRDPFVPMDPSGSYLSLWIMVLYY
jgi:hypothetical protein